MPRVTAALPSSSRPRAVAGEVARGAVEFVGHAVLAVQPQHCALPVRKALFLPGARQLEADEQEARYSTIDTSVQPMLKAEAGRRAVGGHGARQPHAGEQEHAAVERGELAVDDQLGAVQPPCW